MNRPTQNIATYIWRKLRLHLDWESKLRNKMILMLLALTTLPFGLFAVLATQKGATYIYLETKEEIVSQSKNLSQFIDFHFINQFKTSYQVAVDLNKSEKNTKTISSFLLQRFPNLLAVAHYNVKAEISNKFLRDIGSSFPNIPSNGFWRPLNKTPIAIGKARYSYALRHMAVPIRFQINSAGYFILYFSYDTFRDEILKWQHGDDTEVILTNRAGEVLLHPRFPPGKKLDFEALDMHFPDRNKPASLLHPDKPFAKQSSLTKNDMDKEILRAYSKCPSLGWGVFMERQTDGPAHLVQRMRVVMIAFLAGALLFSLVGSVWIVAHIVAPIEELEAGIKLLENGLLVESLPVRSKDEIARLTMSFNQMAHSLKLREEEVKNKNRKLVFFNDITRTINQTKDLKQVLDISIQKMMILLHAASGWIYIFDPLSKKLRCLTHQGLTETPQEEFTVSEASDHIVLQTFQKGKPHILRDIYRLGLRLNGISMNHIRDLMVIPLRSQNTTLGVLGIGSRRSVKFRYKELDLLTKIGDELGIAIENAHLYNQLQLKINELEDVNKDLQEVDRFKNRILSNVSHELRTPITSIKTYIELFITDKIGTLEDFQKEKLVIVRRNINHLLTLIDDLLTLARIQDQKMQLKNQELVALDELVEHIVSENEEVARAKGIELLRSGTQETIMVRINQTKIRQVIQNLVSNAMKFTESGAVTIDLSLRQAKNEQSRTTLVDVSIIDTGIGIPKKAMAKIFHRFYQVDSSSTRKYVGTGLGLSIVKEILEAHDATIQVESTTNKGSRFWFSFPVVNKIQQR